MSVFLLKVVIFWTIFMSTVLQHTYALDIDPNGIYSDIIVEISDKVPRQKCQRALDNLEVRTSSTNFIIFIHGFFPNSSRLRGKI